MCADETQIRILGSMGRATDFLILEGDYCSYPLLLLPSCFTSLRCSTSPSLMSSRVLLRMHPCDHLCRLWLVLVILLAPQCLVAFYSILLSIRLDFSLSLAFSLSLSLLYVVALLGVLCPGTMIQSIHVDFPADEAPSINGTEALPTTPMDIDLFTEAWGSTQEKNSPQQLCGKTGYTHVSSCRVC